MIHRIKKHISSQENAIKGLKEVFLREQNFRIEIFIAIAVLLQGIYFSFTAYEWIAIILCFTTVLSAESMNTSIERACDAITKDFNKDIKSSKDIGAAGVLIAAIGAVAIEIIIVAPKLGIFL